jgi:hypothetical protein
MDMAVPEVIVRFVYAPEEYVSMGSVAGRTVEEMPLRLSEPCPSAEHPSTYIVVEVIPLSM